jgi:HPt (histidine-containing phosphotransfer) domain-containing protein
MAMPKNALKPDTPQDAGRKRLKAFDIVLLRRYSFEDPELERELIELFRGQLPLLVSQLAEAKGQSDWHLAAHTLKGSARSIGAPALAELALELEQIGYQENPVRAKLASQVEAAVKEFETAIEAHFRRS